MKVVIDISENDYRLACNHPDALIACYAHYIKNGIPLPERHGRLVDADAYVSMMEEKCDYGKALDPYALSVCRGGIKLMPTIVEAEGEEGEI